MSKQWYAVKRFHRLFYPRFGLSSCSTLTNELAGTNVAATGRVGCCHEITDTGDADERRRLVAERCGVLPNFTVKFGGKGPGIIAAICRGEAGVKVECRDVFGDTSPLDACRVIAHVSPDVAVCDYVSDIVSEVRIGRSDGELRNASR